MFTFKPFTLFNSTHKAISVYPVIAMGPCYHARNHFIHVLGACLLPVQGIAKELAQSINARKPYDASPDAHNAIMGLFNGLGFSDSAIADVVGACTGFATGFIFVASDSHRIANIVELCCMSTALWCDWLMNSRRCEEHRRESRPPHRCGL